MLRILWIPLALSACSGLFDNECGPEARSTVISTDLRDTAAAVIGRVTIALTEMRGTHFPMTMSPSFSGPAYGDPGPLSGRVQHARLLTSAGDTLRDFVVEPGNSMQFILVQTEFFQDDAEFQALRGQFLTGHLLIELTTDIPGMETLRAPLPVERATGWARSTCPW